MKHLIQLPRIPAKPLALLLGAVFTGLLSWSGIFHVPELATYDARLRLKAPQPIDPRVVIIEISDDTISKLGQWPIERRYHAALVEALKRAGARRIVFDILFSESSGDDPVLRYAIEQSGSVYLPKAFYLGEGVRRRASWAESAGLLAGVAPTIGTADKAQGHINVFVDPDGKVRRLPLFIKVNGALFPSLGFRAAADELGLDIESASLLGSRAVWRGKAEIPLGAQGAFFVNYPGFWAQSFPHYSYLDVLKADVVKLQGGVPFLDPAVFKDKICVIGLTATGTADIRPNPLEKIFPMVGTQAAVINGILTGNYIRETAPWVRVAVAIAVFLVSSLAVFSASPLRGLAVSAGAGLAYTLAAVGLFVARGIWVDLFLPLFIIVVNYGIGLAYSFFREARRRQLLEKELEIASAIQNSFLPKNLCSREGFGVAALLKPAKFVAGDLYDVIPLSQDKVGVFIADVSGKGVPAALLMAQTISLLRIFSRGTESPADVLAALNKELSQILEGRFVTAQYVIVDLGRRALRGACAGHPSLFYYDRGRAEVTEKLGASGPPLGLVPGASYATEEWSIGERDKIFLYTDGWTEARSRRGEEFGSARLKELFSKHRDLPAGELLEILRRQQEGFERGAPAHDDATAVMLEF